MANFNISDDDDFADIFLTQSSSGNSSVSLENDMEFKSVLDPQYSDISDVDEEENGDKIRFDFREYCIIVEKFENVRIQLIFTKNWVIEKL